MMYSHALNKQEDRRIRIWLFLLARTRDQRMTSGDSCSKRKRYIRTGYVHIIACEMHMKMDSLTCRVLRSQKIVSLAVRKDESLLTVVIKVERERRGWEGKSTR